MRAWNRRMGLGLALVTLSGWFAVSLVSEPIARASQEPEPAPASDFDLEFLRLHARTRGFQLGQPSGVQVTPDGTAVLFLRGQPDEPASHLYEWDVAKKEARILLTPEELTSGQTNEQLSAEERARRERQRTAGARGLASFQMFPDGQRLLIPFSGKLYVFHRGQRSTQPLNAGPGVIDPKIAPDGKFIGYVRGQDVYVLDLEKNEEQRVTEGGTADVSHGLAEFVAQEEMNRFSGWWWSPDSQFICYQESDAREVEVWHVGDPGRPGARPLAQRYPRPGKNNVKVRLGVIARTGGTTTWLDWNTEEFPYLVSVKWPRLDRLTVVVQNRLQQEMRVLLADPAKGTTRVVHTARDPAWVNINQSVPHWLEDGSGFFWIADGDRGGQLEWYPAEGASSARLVVPDSAGFGGLVHVDEAAGLVYFVDKSDPTQRHLARVSFKTPDARPERLTEEVGIHSATFAKNGSLYVHRHTGPRSLGTSTVRAADGKELGTLPSVALPPPHWPTTEFLTIGSDPELRASITRPRRFEPGRKYPVIVQVYGGPTVQTVQQSAGSHFLHQWYADHGFIVVAIDNRGTPGRGRNWERSIYGDFGQLPLADQVEGLRLLGERFPELDLSRVGIKGWSFGGYMSALAVLKRPDVFHAAVAGAPVSDWEDYDTHYTERYLGLPKDNAAGYKSSSLLPLAEKLMRPLLLVHGSADDNVYFIHSLKLADALFRHGQPFELLVMKNQTHGVRDPRLRERLEERTLRFFRQHLIEAPRSGPAAGQ